MVEWGDRRHKLSEEGYRRMMGAITEYLRVKKVKVCVRKRVRGEENTCHQRALPFVVFPLPFNAFQCS